jgi:hypothetical protein
MYKMKQILFLIIALISTVSVKGQTVVIECQGGAGVTTCFLTDPTPFNTIYVANINDGDKTVSNGWNRSQPEWIAVGGTVGSPNSGIQTNVQWLNTPNTPQKTIQVKVTYKKAGQADVVVQNTKNVTVKHIGKITSATIQNGNPTTINGSGLTVQIPCGTAPFTISVPAVVTDPAQTVNYSSNVPSGFGSSQASATSNVFTITPTAGGGGIVRINAKRTDGTVIQSFDINLSTTASEVGTPTITFSPFFGGFENLLCTNDYGVFQAAAINGTSFTWSTTGSIVKSDILPGLVSVQMSGGGGSGILTLNANNACGTPKSVSKTIFTGPPTVTPTVNWGPLYYPNYIQNPCFLRLSTNETGLSYNYQVLNGTGNIYGSGDPAQVYVYAYPFVRIEGTATNRCGSTSNTFYLQNGTPYYRMASTNPTQSIISVELDKESAKETLVSVKLVSHGRNALERSFTAEDARRTNHFERSNKVDFDVANLPRGTYYLLIDFKNYKTFKEIIVLN